MNTKTLLAAAALALTVATPSFAADGFRPVIGMSLTGGGKTLLKVQMDDNSTQRISSGGLVHLFGGFEYRAEQSPLTFQANVGYHVDDIGASNGDASFSRVPFELLGFWNTADNFRVGGGLRKATSSKFTSSGAAEVGDFNMRTSLGFVLQGEYLFGEHASVFLRYVHEDYKSNLLQGGEVSGDHAGIGMAYRF
jgi:opacity protein-like surface antigen